MGFYRVIMEHVLLCRISWRKKFCQGKFIQGWWLCEIWPIDGAARSLNKCTAAFHVVLSTPRHISTRKSRGSKKCSFHPFSFTLLILKMVVTAMKAAFWQAWYGQYSALCLRCCILISLVTFLMMKTNISSPKITNLICFKGHLKALCYVLFVSLTWHMSSFLPP